MRLRVRVMLCIASVGLVTGCVHHSSACPQETPVGAWRLRTINGAPMPFTLSQSGVYKAEMVAVTLDVGADGRFTILSHQRESMSGKVNDETSPDSGSYTLTGPALTLRFQSDGKTTIARLGCQTLTMQERGGTYVFAR